MNQPDNSDPAELLRALLDYLAKCQRGLAVESYDWAGICSAHVYFSGLMQQLGGFTDPQSASDSWGLWSRWQNQLQQIQHAAFADWQSRHPQPQQFLSAYQDWAVTYDRHYLQQAQQPEFGACYSALLNLCLQQLPESS